MQGTKAIVMLLLLSSWEDPVGIFRSPESKLKEHIFISFLNSSNDSKLGKSLPDSHFYMHDRSCKVTHIGITIKYLIKQKERSHHSAVVDNLNKSMKATKHSITIYISVKNRWHLLICEHTANSPFAGEAGSPKPIKDTSINLFRNHRKKELLITSHFDS